MGYTTTKEEALALSLLTRYWNQTIPVDPMAMARLMGVSVSVGGPVARVDVGAEGGANLQIPEDLPAETQRFVCAHLMGHWVMGHGPIQDDKPCHFQPHAYGIAEFEANTFALSLLVPRGPAMSLAVSGHHHIAGLAQMFKVVPAVMAWQLHRFGLVSRPGGVQSYL